MSRVQIVVDARERFVVDAIKAECHRADYHCTVATITTGDYAIMIDGIIRVIIERKTWQDMASSLQDGRSRNSAKLLALRDEAASDLPVHIFYVMEGRRPAYNGKVKRIPVTSLLARIDHLSMRDGIAMIYTQDAQDTAARIVILARNTLSLVKKHPTGGGAAAAAAQSDASQAAVRRLKQAPPPPSEEKTQVDLLCGLGSVGRLTAEMLFSAQLSVAALLVAARTIDVVALRDTLAQLRFSTGSQLGEKKARNIGKVLRSMDRRPDGENAIKTSIRILGNIRGVSAATAKKLIEGRARLLHDVSEGLVSAIDLAQMQRSEKSTVGPAVAKSIHAALSTLP